MRALTPVENDPRSGIPQQELFTVLHDKPLLLRQIPWTSTRERRGVMETNELERQALINDFEFHGIPVQIRLVSVEALREIHGDPAISALRIMGPGKMAAFYPNQRIPDEEYVITEQWADYPAFFANWLNHQAAEQPRLGADWVRKIKHKTTSADGEITVAFSDEHHPARRLLEWRMPVERATGERASGLVVPQGVNLMADGAAEDEVPAPPPPARRR